MGFLQHLFRSRQKHASSDFHNPVTTELHSHLIPGIDDGTETLADSISVLKELSLLGYKKVITTPHIMGDFYKNGSHNILPGLKAVREALFEADIPLTIEASAEYMVDDVLEEKIASNNLLPFGKNHILIELPFNEEPQNLKTVIFNLQVNGYQPVLAHPERYPYYAGNKSKYEELTDGGVLLQMNILSLIGYYSPDVKKAAEYLIDKKLISLVGSDIHGIRHLPYLREALNTNYYEKVCGLGLLNNQL